MHISVLFENKEVFRELLQIPEVNGIYLPGDKYSMRETREAAFACRQAGKEFYYAFPYVFREDARLFYETHGEALRELNCDGWLIRSLDEAGFVNSLALSGLRIFDAGMYSWNSMAEEQLRFLGADILTLPYELNQKEMASLSRENRELVIYGRLPVMVTAQCMQKNGAHRCLLNSGQQESLMYPLKDRKGTEFLAENRCRFCMNVIYNSVPLWILDQEKAFPDRVRFHFTAETPEETRDILERFLRGERKPQPPFTRGHFSRGVE